MEQYANRLPAGLVRYALSGDKNKQLVDRLKEVSGWRFTHPFTDLLHLKRVFSLVCETQRCFLCGRSVMPLLALITVAFKGCSRRCRWKEHRRCSQPAFDAHVSGDTLVFTLRRCCQGQLLHTPPWHAIFFFLFTGTVALSVLLTSQQVKCCLALVLQCCFLDASVIAELQCH